MSTDADELLDRLGARSTFPDPGASAIAGCSGGPDSAAMLALARHAGVAVTAVHVQHGVRPDADADAALAERQAAHFAVPFRLEHAQLADGPNLEARARDARRRILGPDAMTGHTVDDQAETLLLALLRGAGAAGLSSMAAGVRHPILALRRAETHALCAALGIEVATDPTNTLPRFRRNRIRHEVIPLLDEVAARDVSPLLDRTASLLRSDDELLEALAIEIDPTDVAALRDAPLPLARRALRRWLDVDGYPPDAASIERVMSVVRHEVAACEVAGGRRVSRHAGVLHLTVTTRPDTADDA